MFITGQQYKVLWLFLDAINWSIHLYIGFITLIPTVLTEPFTEAAKNHVS